MSDLLNSDGTIFGPDELKIKYKLNLNILHYYRIKHLITKFIERKMFFLKLNWKDHMFHFI